MDFGSVVEIPLRDIWPGEATDFTPWLSENLEVLSDVLGLELELESTEVSAGDFSADIVARDVATNRKIIIENQYGSTDHRHLGQIITYSSVLNAGVVVWVAEKVRSEHKSAIDFLNKNLREDLQVFALEASVIRIDDSKPAFNFKIISMPAEINSGKSTSSVEVSESRERYRTYFQGLLDELRVTHKFTKAKAAQPQNWYTFSSENSKYYKYSASFAQGGLVRIEFYIDCGDKVKNEQIFDYLFAERISINEKFGSELSFEKLETKRACRVAIYRDGSIESDSEELIEIKQWMVLNILDFQKKIRPFLDVAISKL